jgi:hypothetical protein
MSRAPPLTRALCLQVASHAVTKVEDHLSCFVLEDRWRAFQHDMSSVVLDLSQIANLQLTFTSQAANLCLLASDSHLATAAWKLVKVCQSSASKIGQALFGVDVAIDEEFQIPTYDSVSRIVENEETWTSLNAVTSDLNTRVDYFKDRLKFRSSRGIDEFEDLYTSLCI